MVCTQWGSPLSFEQFFWPYAFVAAWPFLEGRSKRLAACEQDAAATARAQGCAPTPPGFTPLSLDDRVLVLHRQPDETVPTFCTRRR